MTEDPKAYARSMIHIYGDGAEEMALSNAFGTLAIS